MPTRARLYFTLGCPTCGRNFGTSTAGVFPPRCCGKALVSVPVELELPKAESGLPADVPTIVEGK